jgi:mono/diheme cytochrome c family protein
MLTRGIETHHASMVPPVSGMQIARRTARPLLTAAALCALVTLLSACSGGEPPAVPEDADGSQDSVLVAGRDVYGQRCASCHASDGSGKRGPKLAGGRVVERYPDVEAQILVVSDGSGAMPAFGSKLTDDEIEAVVRYTREVL